MGHADKLTETQLDRAPDPNALLGSVKFYNFWLAKLYSAWQIPVVTMRGG
jgi:hypothetical protein